ncbi:MAG: LptA/OstA family protein [Desulfomicrobium apsheronum]|nr:LptA/OstA family protein [Desulfomicrobium apsheronum]
MRSLIILLFLACSTPLWAAETVPVKITSDTMTYTQKGDQVIFTGSVYVIRQDIQLWSDTLTVLLEKKDGAKNATQGVPDEQGAIKKIIAKGNVRIKADKGRTGTCGKATYEADKDLLTMEDSPMLMEGANKIQGEVIKLYIKENRSEVLGGKGRVEAIFNTPASKQGLGQ